MPNTDEAFRPSVIIPAHDEAARIAATIAAVRRESAEYDAEIVVVDSCSSDGTGDLAREAGARVIRLEASGNPGRSRNAGAAIATGDPLIFLDADCEPEPGWMRAFAAAHAEGATIAGGSLAMPSGLALSARCDHYATAYHLHPDRHRAFVANHTPANLSVRRQVFEQSGGFDERFPVADGHEELGWQLRASEAGHRILFLPSARAQHHGHPGVRNLIARAYRWGYSSVQSKANAPSVRGAWLYRYPRLVVVTSVPAAFVHTAYICACWMAAGVLEPLWLWPGILVSRLAYGVGSTIGGARWLSQRGDQKSTFRAR